MKISKLLSIILGLSGFMRMGVMPEGGMSLSEASAALSGDAVDPGEQGSEEETDEALAERLAAEEAEGATPPNENADPNEQTAAPANEKITIEVDGKTIEIDKADLPELYKGNLRQKDYTAKTMEVSEQRKAADAEIAKARQERDKYATELNNFAITTSSVLEEQRKVLTQELFDSDPHEYMRQKIIFEGRQEQLGKAQAELQRLSGEYHAEQQQQNQQFMESQYKQVLDAFPEIKDPEKSKKFFSDMDAYMTGAGFTKDDAKFILDARVVILADKARKYEALMTKVKEGKNKVAAAPVKVATPGVAKAAPTDGRTKGMQQLAKSGSMHDAAALLSGI